MERVLVTGGTGVLGRRVVERLGEMGYAARIMSRRPQPAAFAGGLEWAQADLGTGEGLQAALTGVSAIVHAASDPRQRTTAVDVEGTRRLVEATAQAGVDHLVYISIVGIDRVPFAYYRAKLAAEDAITKGAVPWSILRATQFHEFVDLLLALFTRFPVAFLPGDFMVQPVAATEVARALCERLASGPSGRLPDMGGPEVCRLGDLVKPWLQARGLPRLILPLPLPGATAAAHRRGANTCPDHTQGRITWAAWLTERYPSSLTGASL